MRSEKEVLDTKSEQQAKDSSSDSSSSTNRTLHDNPMGIPRSKIEMYRHTHPNEVSKPTEFSTYIRDIDLQPKKHMKTWFCLPSIEEATDILATMEIPAKKVTPTPVIKTLDKGKQREGLTEDDIPRLRQQ